MIVILHTSQAGSRHTQLDSPRITTIIIILLKPPPSAIASSFIFLYYSTFVSKTNVSNTIIARVIFFISIIINISNRIQERTEEPYISRADSYNF
jgi:hypothetical protein